MHNKTIFYVLMDGSISDNQKDQLPLIQIMIDKTELGRNLLIYKT